MAFDWSQYRGGIDWLPSRTILLARSGSHAYGLATPESDLDFKGIAIPPRQYFHGFLDRFEQAEQHDPDLVVYNITKFFSLAADNNPNILEVLWSEPEDYLQVTPQGQKLIDARQLFLSRKAKHTFSGYAHAQLCRIKGHRRWLLNPPLAPPTREEFGLPSPRVISKDQMGAALECVRKHMDSWQPDLSELPKSTRIALTAHYERALSEIFLHKEPNFFEVAARASGYDENFIHFLSREKAYESRLREWNQYQDWKKNRNPQRAELERRYGYDGRHASHLVRLLKMCREILTTGKVIVRRPDRGELLAIKQHCAWPFDQLVEWAEQEDKALDELKESSPLPHSPDRKRLDLLCQEIVWEMLN